jgi:hypothetical protein
MASTIFAIFLILHGLIHLPGVANAFGLAELPQLTQPISRGAGLGAAIAFTAAAISLFTWPRGWWVVAAAGVLLSMFAIVPSWTDAKFGTLANAIVCVGVLFGFLAQGPYSLRAQYERDIESVIARGSPSGTIVEADLAHLPSPVQRYLRSAGVPGRPRVHNVRARMHGRIRSGRQARWMTLRAEQYNAFDPPARFFYFNAAMFAVPIQGYHRYLGEAATMHVKAAAAVPVASASGSEMAQSETVTFFNDMCFLAPATLIDPAIVWEPIDDRTTRATFTNAGHTIRAVLSFNDAGELTNFTSDDRYQASAGSTGMERLRWSTPLSNYRSFGPVRLASRGEGRWHDADGEYAYVELTVDEIHYDVH